MCGRYRLSHRAEALRKHFGVDTEVDWAPRYNIAPTDPVAAIRQSAGRPVREFARMRWGLVPPWAKDVNTGARMINARSETAAELPAFREAFRSRRCLIPADGFYEWQRRDGSKQPFCFELDGGAIFALAGLWERWPGTGGMPLESCSILTTSPNRLVADVHDRMPVILATEHYDLWLDPGFHDVASLAGMLQPYAAGNMRRFPVSTRVNSVRNDDPGVCAAVEAGAAAGRLF
ncbi:MAG: SOS response-associated peptidase [Acidobacteria bacterium]|nr:SOS response-associated peptidase [Acidobacteriota bacterium]